MEIYIVRHGQTPWNIEKRLQGSADIDLTEYGLSLARESGETLKDIRIDKIFSSPLKRAYNTAVQFRNSRDIDIITDERLREISFGNAEGHTAAELIEKPGCTFKYFFDEPLKYHPEENGETFEEAMIRGKDFMENVIEPLAKNPAIKRIMIVGHGAINKAIMCHVMKHGVADYWSGGLQRNCNVMIVDYTDGKYSVINEDYIFSAKDGLALYDDSKELFKTIIKSFISKSDEMRTLMAEFLRNGDMENFRIKAHGLKGNAKAVGANYLSDIAKDMMEHAKNNDIDYIRENYEKLESTFSVTIDALKKY